MGISDCEIEKRGQSRIGQGKPTDHVAGLTNLEGWDREGGRETQEGGDLGIYVYI